MNKKSALLLVNIGSPDSPDPKDVKVYLKQFLMDPYVLDYPWILRYWIVNGLILPKRPTMISKAYESIWSNQEFPLIALSKKVKETLGKRVEDAVEIGMRYGQPSIEQSVQNLIKEHPELKHIKLVPMFPHYAMATVGGIMKYFKKIMTNYPQITYSVIDPFYNHPAYIKALTAQIRTHLKPDSDFVLFSYHGLPERQIKKSDPTKKWCLTNGHCCEQGDSKVIKNCYRAHTRETTHQLIKSLNLKPEQWGQSYQSRLGREKWLGPYTETELIRLAQSGVKHLTVITPAFVTDCLETLEEINEAGRALFLKNGGQSFTFVPCLNDHPLWIEALSTICKR